MPNKDAISQLNLQKSNVLLVKLPVDFCNTYG